MLDRLNVRWLMTEPNRELTDTARYVLRYAGPDGRLYENLHVHAALFRGRRARHDHLGARRRVHARRRRGEARRSVMSSVGWSRWWRVDRTASESPSPPPGRQLVGDERGSTDALRLRCVSLSRKTRGGTSRPSSPSPSAGHTTVRIRYVDIPFRIASLIALLTAAALSAL